MESVDLQHEQTENVNPLLIPPFHAEHDINKLFYRDFTRSPQEYSVKQAYIKLYYSREPVHQKQIMVHQISQTKTSL
jgi:hypothetical protein